jgi:mono/diheme cytochrome c family protein
MTFANDTNGSRDKVRRRHIKKPEREDEMTTTKIKLLAIMIFALSITAVLVFRAAPSTSAAAVADDPAATYKAKCMACHGPAAAKFYDPAKPEEEQIEAIMKGKKGEKPPNMPAFSDKGITEDGAKALAVYMKTLRQ